MERLKSIAQNYSDGKAEIPADGLSKALAKDYAKETGFDEDKMDINR